MIINALNDYYGILAKQGKVLKPGYSNEKAHFLIELSESGELAKITDCKIMNEVIQKNGKTKTFFNPRNVVLPKRTEKPGIDSNIVEHRPLYIFGLNSDKKAFTHEDRTNKATNSHKNFVEKNLAFIEGLDSPIINAYRLFIQSWNPESELNNPQLLTIVKEYPTAKFIFCLESRHDIMLHEDEVLLDKWNTLFSQVKSDSEVTAQCGITGEVEKISRIHNKIKGIAGANATGAGLVVFNNPSDNSYGNDQSYNSNISEPVMNRYTEALNFLLSSRENYTVFDDITIVHFAMSENDKNDKVMSNLIFDKGINEDEDEDADSDGMNAKETEEYLNKTMKDGKNAAIIKSDLAGVSKIDEDVDYYIIGFKPNSSRVSVKFAYKQKIGKIMQNIALHQEDLKLDPKHQTIPFWQLKAELLSPNSKNAKLDPALSAKIWESILKGTNYPQFLLQTVVNRVKLDSDEEKNKFIKINHKRVGILKACINRKARNEGKEEEITMTVNPDNTNQAYLCGRLFAIYEKIQQEASKSELNRTIKDSYFTAACSNPASVFQKIVKLSQHHIKKLSIGRKITLEKLIGEISANLNDEYPKTLPPYEQGKFIVGYYQQNKDLYTSKENKEDQ